MIPALTDLPLFALSAAAFYCLGRLAVGRFMEGWPREAFWALCSAAGMGLFASLFYALGLAGLLKGPLLLATLGLPAAWGLARGWLRLPGLKGLSPTAWAVLAVSVFLYLACHSPLVGHDALCYHLYLAKVFAHSGAVYSIPYHENSDWPLLWEMLYAAGYRLSGAGLAKSYHVYAALLTALLTAGACARFVRSRTPLLGALLVLLSPLAANVSVTAYIDMGLALFSACALFLFLDGFLRNRPSSFALAGFFLGLALSVKFLAVFSAAILGTMLLLRALSEKKRGAWTDLGLFAAAALLAGGYWYAKLWVQYGNPVHPYFGHWFGGVETDILSRHASPIPKNVWGILSAPVWVSLFAHRITGISEQPGPLFLFFAPLGALLRRTFRVLDLLLLYVVVYLGIWVMLYQNLRFLTPLLPAAAVMAVAGLEWTRSRGPFIRKASALLFGLALAVQAGLLIYHFRREYKVLAGAETEQAYLARTEQAYEIAGYLNRTYSMEARLFLPNEVHLYYFDPPVVRGNYLMQDHPDLFKKGTLAEGLAFLKELGFTHVVLLVEPSFADRPFLEELVRATPDSLAAAGAVLEKETVSGQGLRHLLYRLT